jgi:TonB family protein
MALSALAFSSIVSAADAPKAPTGKWVAEYAEDECLLSRPYGTDSDPLILTFRQLPMQNFVRIILFKSGVQGRTQMGEKGKVAFGGEPTSGTFSAFDLAGKPLRRIETNISRTRLMPALQSGVVSIDVPGEVQGDFSVPELASALDILSDCALKLGAAWGVPIEQQERMKTPPKLLKMAFDAFDYPSSALKDDMSGRTEVRLTVDTRGRPVDCIPLKSTPNQAFARASCNALYRRAHFKPALDLDGKPMKSIYVQTVNFMIAG